MKHYFMTLPDVVFPENRFCAKCGEYFTHTNHLHGRDCQWATATARRVFPVTMLVTAGNVTGVTAPASNANR